MSMRRILLDQNVPFALGRLLTGHSVAHAADLGWGELANGDLIAAAERDGFEVLLTADQNIRYQQNLTNRRIGIVVLESNRWATLKANLPLIVVAAGQVEAGGYRAIAFQRLPLRRRPPPA